METEQGRKARARALAKGWAVVVVGENRIVVEGKDWVLVQDVAADRVVEDGGKVEAVGKEEEVEDRAERILQFL